MDTILSNQNNQEIKTLLPSFGLALRECREEKNISQSRLAMLAQVNLSNLRNIEKGKLHVGIRIAVNLILATKTNLNDFFCPFISSQKLLTQNRLHCSSSLLTKQVLLKQHKELIKNISQEESTQAKSLFGIVFREFRKAHKVSQAKVAEYAQCDLRNMRNIEKGSQDTGVIRAILFLCAVAQNSHACIEVFFYTLQILIQLKEEKQK